MTTEENFFVRQDVTGFFKMLHGGRAQGGAVRGACGVWRGEGLRGVVRRGFAVGRGGGLRSGDSGPGCGVGIIWGKMGNFLPFCRFLAVWVEICGNRKLVSLPFRRFFCCLGRDLWQPETGFSTLFASFSLFG